MFLASCTATVALCDDNGTGDDWTLAALAGLLLVLAVLALCVWRRLSR